MGVANDPSVSYDQLKKAVDKAKLLEKTLKEANPNTLNKMDKALNGVDKTLKAYDTTKKLVKMGSDIVRVTQILMKVIDKILIFGEAGGAAASTISSLPVPV